MTEDLKKFIESVEAARLTATQSNQLKGGLNDPGMGEFNSAVLCGFNLFECHDQKCSPFNTDDCGPSINPLLKVTCRRDDK